MNVLYDSYILTIQKFGGVSRLYCDLIEEFENNPQVHAELACKFTNNEYLLNSPAASVYSSPWIHRFRGGVRAGLALNSWLDKRALKKRDIDLVHLTFFEPALLSSIGDIPYVFTIYDMNYDLFPDQFVGAEREIANKKILAEGASNIIAISECTKRDIVEYMDVAEEKISVVHLCSRFEEIKSKKPAGEIDSDYVLFVGSRYAYKNFDTMLEAFAKTASQHPGVELICAGGGKFSAAETTAIAELGLEQRVRQLSLTDRELKFCYENARCFIFPSRFEGFGIPVLESFASGCPTILSNATSLPEVAGGAALLFDPDDADELAGKINDVLCDPALAEQLRAAGRERLSHFSPQKMALETQAVYEKVLRR